LLLALYRLLINWLDFLFLIKLLVVAALFCGFSIGLSLLRTDRFLYVFIDFHIVVVIVILGFLRGRVCFGEDWQFCRVGLWGV
jgi:hypothetical protein